MCLRSRAAQPLIAAAWLASTSSIPCELAGKPCNLGFVVACVLLAGACMAGWEYVRIGLRGTLATACGLACAAFIVASLPFAGETEVWAATGRACAVFLWAAVLLAFGEHCKLALAWAALILVVVNLTLAVASVASIVRLRAFEIGTHEFVGGLARFRGFAHSPAPEGIWLVAGVGLAEHLESLKLRRLVRLLALVESFMTLSLATLAAPVMLARLVVHRPWRWPLLALATLFAIALLYTQPLAVAEGDHRATLSRLHPNYDDQGLGSRYQPVRRLTFGKFAIEGHATVYGKLAMRALTCFGQHPLLGVGPGRFRDACPVMAMNTFGEWTDSRGAHNQYGALLSELGCLGLGLLFAAGVVLMQSYTFRAADAWRAAAWLAILLCAFGSEALLTLPVAALFATGLVPRKSAA